MEKFVTNDDYCRAAKKIKCEVAAIKAVSDVESKGKAFYPDGFPVILFERHKFRQFTNGVYNKSHPHLSGPQGNYGPAGQNQRNKFNEAFALNPDAAMMSCSWGKYQLMGFNYRECGFKSVGDFVDAMKSSEGAQLDAFVSFVMANHLDSKLRAKDWSGFAKGYNGTGYKKNKYDSKMAVAYAKFAKENIDCSGAKKLVNTTVDSRPVIETDVEEAPADTPSEDVPEMQDNSEPGEAAPQDTAKAGEPVVGGRPGDEPKEVDAVKPAETSGWGAWVANIRAQYAAAGLGFPALGSLAFVTNPLFIKVAIGIIVLAVIISLSVYLTTIWIKSKEKREREQRAHELTMEQLRLAADPTKYNVVIKGGTANK